MLGDKIELIGSLNDAVVRSKVLGDPVDPVGGLSNPVGSPVEV